MSIDEYIDQLLKKERKDVLLLFKVRLRHRMIMEILTAEALNKIFTEKIEKIDSRAERIFLLKKVYSLKEDRNDQRDLGVLYLGTITPFFSGVYEMIVDEERLFIDEVKIFNEEKNAIIFPALPHCFVHSEDFKIYFNLPQIIDLYDKDENELFYLKPGKKTYLSGLAHTLKNKGKMIESIKTSQNLAKVFCSFFHVKYNKIEEKQFQPDRAKIDYFKFIR